ncbi:MAG: oligoendopeptidase F [Clostridia bacterium]|nr:oligoendopeptidase F [Clostridia bacterium]
MKARNEIDPKYQWDFTPIFENDAAWEKELSAVSAEVEKLSAVEGTLSLSRESFKAGIDALMAVSQRFERVYSYANLHRCADGGNPLYQEMDGKAARLYVRFSTAFAFAEPEILGIPEEVLSSFLAPEEMKPYRHFIENITRSRAHSLDKAGEKLLARLGDVADAPSDAYEMLTNVDMALPIIHDENGNEVQLSSGNFSVYRESPVRTVREEAFKAMFGTYGKFNNTFAAMYAGSVKTDCFFSSVREYPSSCEAALFRTNVPVSVYDSLIEAVHESLPSMRAYLELRKKALGLEKLDMYDLYCPMVPNAAIKIPFEESKALVKGATLPLGEEYQKLLDRAYEEQWMDVYENKGKRSGAFSAGVYGVHPYVLLNYTDTLDDVFTVAHELGHSMHSYYSDHAQDYLNHDYEIFVAEVASTVNEVLLTKYLLSTETDKTRRAYILNHFLEGFRTTVFRQTLFAEFERKAHDLYEAGTPLTASVLNNLYKELCELYYAGAEVPEEIQYEWSYIPHFYRAFYVYQYATGFSSAVSIATHLVETGDNKGYLKFLSLGGSDYAINELKVGGVDLTSPEPIREAMRVFAQSVKELSDLLENL